MKDNIVAEIILRIRNLESTHSAVTELSATWPNHFSRILCSYRMSGEISVLNF